MHDVEAKKCLMTTLRTEAFNNMPDTEAMVDILLDALAREGLFVVRGEKDA
jgi:hypothetical protein